MVTVYLESAWQMIELFVLPSSVWNMDLQSACYFIAQGEKDSFLPAGQLLPDHLVAASASAGIPLNLRMQKVNLDDEPLN